MYGKFVAIPNDREFAEHAANLITNGALYSRSNVWVEYGGRRMYLRRSRDFNTQGVLGRKVKVFADGSDENVVVNEIVRRIEEMNGVLTRGG